MTGFESEVKCSFIKPRTESILLIEPVRVDISLLDWMKSNKPLLKKTLSQYGAILLRGFRIHAVSEFNAVIQVLSNSLLDYVFRSTPRTKLGGKIYTATEYPADRVIPMHNENSYCKNWPNFLFFFCAIPATEGGETPLADSRVVYKKINRSIREAFEKKQLLYVRNYTTGIDLSWQEVFQTQDKNCVSQFCQDNSIEFFWKSNDAGLTTKETCQASIAHPFTKEFSWFNQAHLFHFSALRKEDQQSLLCELGEANLPRNVFYGDGSTIEEDTLNHIRQVYEEEKVVFKWQKGDILLVDNLLMAHGRQPYRGERKIAVAMAKDL